MHRVQGGCLWSLVAVLFAYPCATGAQSGQSYEDDAGIAWLRVGAGGDIELIDVGVAPCFEGAFPPARDVSFAARFPAQGPCVAFVDAHTRLLCLKGEIEQGCAGDFPDEAAYAHEFTDADGRRVAVIDAAGNLRLLGTLYIDGTPFIPVPMELHDDSPASESAAALSSPPVVSFADPRLERAVRHALGKPQGTLTPADVQDAGFTHLRAVGLEISDLSGIESCANLSSLELDYNEIRDIGPLRSLRNLRRLSLNANAVEDLAGIEALGALEQLELARNGLADISPLGALARLRLLNLEHNRVSDLSPLGALADLEWLLLAHNDIGDLGPLNALRRLRWLRFADNRVDDLAPLSRLTSLTGLEGARNGIEDINPIAGLIALRFLDLADNVLGDMGAIQHLAALEELRLHRNHLWDVSQLRDLRALRLLSIGSNYVVDPSCLAGLSELRILYMDRTLVLSADPLRRLKACSRISLSKTPVVSVKSLLDLPALRYLELVGNRLTDENATSVVPRLRDAGVEVVWDGQVLSPAQAAEAVQGYAADVGAARPLDRIEDRDGMMAEVDVTDPNLAAALRENLGMRPDAPISVADLETLEVLDAVSRGIRVLHGLEFCANLKVVNLTGNRIRDLGPLSNLRDLKYAYLSNNWIDDVRPLASLHSLEGLFLDHNNIAHIDGLESLVNLRMLDLGYNRIVFIQALAALENLDYLVLAHNRVWLLEPLARLPRLNWLMLSHNRFYSIEPLYRNKAIGPHTTIDLRGNEIAPNAISSGGDQRLAIHINGATLLTSEFTRLNIGQYEMSDTEMDDTLANPVKVTYIYPYEDLDLVFPWATNDAMVIKQETFVRQENPHIKRPYVAVTMACRENYFLPNALDARAPENRVPFLLWSTRTPSLIDGSPHALAHLHMYKTYDGMIIEPYSPMGYIEIVHDTSDSGGDVHLDLSQGARILSTRELEDSQTEIVVVGPSDFEIVLRAGPRPGFRLARWEAEHSGLKQSMWTQTAKIRWTPHLEGEAVTVRPVFVPVDEDPPVMHEIVATCSQWGYVQMAVCEPDAFPIGSTAPDLRRLPRPVWLANACPAPEGATVLIENMKEPGYAPRGWTGFPGAHGEYTHDGRAADADHAEIFVFGPNLLRRNVRDSAEYEALSRPMSRCTVVNRIAGPDEGPGYMMIQARSYYDSLQSESDGVGAVVMEVMPPESNPDGAISIPLVIRRPAPEP